MKIALYVGNHEGASLQVRLGAALTRLAQKGPWGHVTHVEAILAENADGTCTVASSVLTEGGVRIARRVLAAGDWVIVNVPQWDLARARAWFEAHQGEPYDWRGALATVLPGHDSTGYFCCEAVGAAVDLETPEAFTTAQFAAIAVSLAKAALRGGCGVCASSPTPGFWPLAAC